MVLDKESVDRQKELHPPALSPSLLEVDILIEAATQSARETPQQAIALVAAARAAAEALGRPDRIALALLAEADARYFGAENAALPRAEQAANLAARIAADSDALEIEIAALTRLSRIVSRRGDLTGAFAYGNRRIELARTLQRKTGCALELAEALSGMAAIRLNAFDYLGAAPLFTEALTLVRQMPPQEEPARQQRREKTEAILMGNRAIIQAEAGQHAEAAATFAEVARLHAQRNDLPPRIKVLGNLVDCYLALDRLPEATAACDEALAAMEASGIRQSEAGLRLRQGRILHRRNRWKEADAAFAAGIARIDVTGERFHLPLLLAERGRIASQRGKHAAALRLLQHAVTLCADPDRAIHAREVYRQMTEVAEASGDLELALNCSKRYQRLCQEAQAAAAERRVAVAMAALEAEAMVRTARLEAERLRSEVRRMEEVADRDALTGLHNRRFLERWLPERLEEARRSGAPYSIVLLDLDDFKGINDRFSHEMGDYVLRATARLLKVDLRREDACVRYGGEEFLLVMPGRTRDEAAAVCERLRERLAHYPWHDVHRGLGVTASIGVADDSEAGTAEGILAIADERLYLAKSAGKNRVVAAARTRLRPR